MTIAINDVTRIVRYTATGGQTTFTVPFEFYAANDLDVYNGSTLLTYSQAPADATEYSVTGEATEGGGTIVLGPSGATEGDTIVIISDLAVERQTDFPISGPFQIDQLNEELDKLTIMIAQNETDIENRVLRIADFDDPNTLSAIPNKATRANKVLGFDANGQPTVSAGTLSGGVPLLAGVTPSGDELFYFVDGSTGGTVSFTSFARDFITALSGLSDPDVDSVLIWDDSESTWAWSSISSLIVSATLPTIRTFAGTTDTLVLGDAGNIVHSTGSLAATITVPPVADVAWATGSIIEVKQAGTGLLSFAAGTGVTIESYNGVLDMAGQNAVAALRYEGGNVWVLGGELSQATSFLATANNLSDLDSAATARTNLGLAIGTDVQAYDAGLADVAGLTPTDGNIIVGDGANWVAESGATARASLGLTIGTNVQAWDALLDDIAALSPTAGEDGYVLTYNNGTGNLELAAASGGAAYATVRTVSGTTDTLVLGDENNIVETTNASAVTITVPPNSSVAFNVGSFIEIHQDAAGLITIAPGSGVTIRSRNSILDSAGEDSILVLRKVGTDEWVLSGDLAFAAYQEEIMVAVSDETTALTTGTAKVTFRMPFAMTLAAVRASVNTAPTGAAISVDINEGGVSILSTALTIDATEKTSTTAATPAVISDSALADDAEITIDIDAVGSTVAGAGLKVTLIGTRA